MLRLVGRPAAARSRSPTKARRSAPAARSPTRSRRARAGPDRRSPCSRPRAAGCAGCSRPPSPRSATHPRGRRCAPSTRSSDARRVGGGRRAREPVRGRARHRRHRAGQGHVQHRRPAGDRSWPRRSGAAERCARERRRTHRRRRRGGELAARVPGAGRRGGDGRRRRETVGSLVAPRRGRGLPLLRPHLHDGLVPAPDRPAADRRQGLPDQGQGRAARSTTSAATSTPSASRSTTTAPPLTDADGAPLPKATRTAGLRRAPADVYGFTPHVDGAWYRCCGGRVRKLVDCCGDHAPPHQRRQGADGLLLPRPQGLLRHVLRHEGQVLIAVVVIAALVAGVTGAWSPCGFSMVETLAPAGYARAAADHGDRVRDVRRRRARRRRRSPSAASRCSATRSAPTAPARGRGDRARRRGRRGARRADRAAGPPPGPGVLAARACPSRSPPASTASCSASASRPSSSRFAVWALAGIAVALGDPALGLLIGLAFGAGRALPVIALAPFGGGAAARGDGRAAAHPALAAARSTPPRWPSCAVDAVRRARAGRGQRLRRRLRRPDASTGATLALHRPGGPGELRGPAGVAAARPATTPRSAAGRHGLDRRRRGGRRRAWARSPRPAPTRSRSRTRGSPGAPGRRSYAAPLDRPRPRARSSTGAVGRPALSGNLLVFDVDGRIESFDLATGVRTMLRREARAQLRGPSVLGDRLAYVQGDLHAASRCCVGPLRPQRPSSDRRSTARRRRARRDAGHEPGRFPARGHINKPLWERPPGGRHGHADDDRDARRRRLRHPRAQARGPAAGAGRRCASTGPSRRAVRASPRARAAARGRRRRRRPRRPVA